jgi:sporulation protein YlmC with PRC-barrel domain
MLSIIYSLPDVKPRLLSKLEAYLEKTTSTWFIRKSFLDGCIQSFPKIDKSRGIHFIKQIECCHKLGSIIWRNTTMNTTKKNKKPFRLGTPVFAGDRKAGRITKIIADPGKRLPLYLAVRTGWLRRGREIVVPISLVSSASAEKVALALTKDELQQFPDYEFTFVKEEYKKSEFFPSSYGTSLYYPPDNSYFRVIKQRSVPDHSIAVEKGMQVFDHGGQKVGRVKGLILDKTLRQANFIVLSGDYFAPLKLIDTRVVQDVSSTGVKLSIDWKTVEKLPEFSKKTAKSLSAGMDFDYKNMTE